MKYLLPVIFGLVLFIQAACKKEPTSADPAPPTEPPINVQIFEPGDTSLGAAYADKLGNDWAASVYCAHSYLDKEQLDLIFYTYDEVWERESVEFYHIPSNMIGKFRFTTATHIGIGTLSPGEISTSYARWLADGDLLEDIYRADSTDMKNRLVITKMDLANKRIEGTFHVAYQNIGPNFGANNPLKVTFSSGRFWATIRD